MLPKKNVWAQKKSNLILRSVLQCIRTTTYIPFYERPRADPMIRSRYNLRCDIPPSDTKTHSQERKRNLGVLTTNLFRYPNMHIYHLTASTFCERSYRTQSIHKKSSNFRNVYRCNNCVVTQNPYVAPLTCSFVRQEPKKPQPMFKRQIPNSNNAEDSVGPL